MADYQYLKGVPGQKNWYSYWTALIDFLQGATNEVETARQGQANLNVKITAMDSATTAVTSEVTTARQGQVNLNAKITAMDSATTAVTNEVETARQGQANLNAAFNQYVLKSGWTANFNAMNYRLTGLADAINPLDAVNLQQVTSLIQGGGSPSNIPITALGIGTATALQLYRVNADGLAIEGVTPSSLAPSLAPNIEITLTNKGTAQNGHLIGVSNGVVIGRNITYDLMFYGAM
jgi:hypothetical protein